MRRHPLDERGPGLEGYSLLAVLAVVVVLEFHTFVYCVFAVRLPVGDLSGYRGHLLLLGGYGVALALWTTASTRGWVGTHTGSGFRVAALGLVSHLLSTYLLTAGLAGGISVYDLVPQVSGLVWLERNVGLAAYAFGLVFVALSSWSDWRMRRTAPKWVIPHEG